MSRIGKRPITIPAKVQVVIDGAKVVVKGPKGELSRTLTPNVSVSQEGEILQVNRRDDTRTSRQLHGLSRTLVANMVEGVTNGYSKSLEIQGVGYRAQLKGKNLELALGFDMRDCGNQIFFGDTIDLTTR